jgi:osmoprotectant transport system permease protein
MSAFTFMWNNRSQMIALTSEHLVLVFVSIAVAILIGVPTGIALTRQPRWTKPILTFANIVQTIPSPALFGFLIPLPFLGGIGATTAIVALVLYSLLPVIRGTFAGISGVDPAVREAGRAMGMTNAQLLFQVEFPLALPVMFSGIRVATVVAIGVATIAATIGAGGLGMFIFRGVSMLDNRVILAGAIPSAVMALCADWGLGALERVFVRRTHR